MLSLRSQLLITFVGLIAATVIGLTAVAHRTATVNLVRDARRSVRVAAEVHGEAISRLVKEQQQRAEGFLAAVALLCGERADERITWELTCARRALEELRTTERATGALLTDRSRRIAAAGDPVEASGIGPAFLARTPGPADYVVVAEDDHATLRLQFSLNERLLFAESPRPGTRGEIFLRESGGRLLTPRRAPDSSRASTAMDAGSPCPTRTVDRIVGDGRGAATIQGIHPVTAFSTPTCVEARVALADAIAPLPALLQDMLVPGGLFLLIGIGLALVAAHWISSSVRRLAVAVRVLETGDFRKPAPVGGPIEVRRLARSFAAMARALGEQMAREQQARRDAEDANRAKDEFLAVLSHELRTPLTATLGWTRLLRMGHLDASRAERALAAIERSALTQGRLIEDLLDVSRFIAGRFELQTMPVALLEPVRSALEGIRPAAEDKHITVTAFWEAAPTVIGDPLRLQQIAGNLLANAVKFTPPGGSITVRLKLVDGEAELSVADSGAGIAPEFLPHVFEQFRQADGSPSRPHGGLGLGLAIVRHLVVKHGGRVHASSAGRGAGATFVVRLPLAASGAEASRLGATPGPMESFNPVTVLQRADREAQLASLRILVVEDDDATRDVVSALLEDAGAVVDAAASAREAHAYLSESDYAVIVSDIAMPQEDGFTFMRALRASRRSEPAIALTALARPEETAAEARAAGYQVYLAKPVDREQLIATVATLTFKKTA